MNVGWICLHRKILDWEWYSDINVRILFLHCLIIANHKDKSWKNIEVKKGSFITSYNKLAEQTGLTPQQVRTSITKLISTREITVKTTNKYTMLSICNYEIYQIINEIDNKQNNTQFNNQITDEQHTNNKQITTTKQYNNTNKKTIKQKNNIEFSFDNFNLELHTDIQDFINFKKSIKKSFISQDQLEKWYNKLQSLSQNNTDIAKQIIAESIVNGWQGIFAPKNITAPTTNGTAKDYDDDNPYKHLPILR